MGKDYYRSFLIDVKPFIKLNFFCKVIGLNPATLSLFLRGRENDYMISTEKLSELESLIIQTMRNFA